MLRRLREACTENEQSLAKGLYWAGAGLLLVVLSLETYTYCIDTISDRLKARWAILMSLSILWGVYAAVMLSIGFWRRARPVRLAALGLFAVTALKLVLVDLAGIRQIYRILSFLVLGLLMIGVSYLYHRVEKHLAASEAQEP